MTIGYLKFESPRVYKMFLIDIHMWNVQLGKFKCDRTNNARNFKHTKLWARNSGGIHGMNAPHQKTGNLEGLPEKRLAVISWNRKEQAVLTSKFYFQVTSYASEELFQWWRTEHICSRPFNSSRRNMKLIFDKSLPHMKKRRNSDGI